MRLVTCNFESWQVQLWMKIEILALDLLEDRIVLLNPLVLLHINQWQSKSLISNTNSKSLEPAEDVARLPRCFPIWRVDGFHCPLGTTIDAFKCPLAMNEPKPVMDVNYHFKVTGSCRGCPKNSNLVDHSLHVLVGPVGFVTPTPAPAANLKIVDVRSVNYHFKVTGSCQECPKDSKLFNDALRVCLWLDTTGPDEWVCCRNWQPWFLGFLCFSELWHGWFGSPFLLSTWLNNGNRSSFWKPR